MNQLYNLAEEDLYLTTIEYNIQSFLEGSEISRYCQEINGRITKVDAGGNEVELMGTIKAFKLLFDLTNEVGDLTFNIIDHAREIMDVAGELIDTSTGTWYDKVDEYFDYTVFDQDLLILTRIEIFPKFRKQGMGKRAIKDLYNNFIQGCGLFALKCFPLQCEKSDKMRIDELRARMNYDQMEKNSRKAFKSLHAYYKNIGFENIKGVDKQVMVINPSIINDQFASIVLD